MLAVTTGENLRRIRGSRSERNAARTPRWATAPLQNRSAGTPAPRLDGSFSKIDPAESGSDRELNFLDSATALERDFQRPRLDERRRVVVSHNPRDVPLR